jgi:hypothetical protein
MFPEIRQEESEHHVLSSASNLEVGVKEEFPCFVFRTVDVEQLTGVWELFDWQAEPLRICEVHEVFGGSRVHQGGYFGSLCNGMYVASNCH